MKPLRQALRLCLMVLHVAAGAGLIGATLLLDRARGVPPMRGAARCAQALWCRWACALFGVSIERSGDPLVDGPVLVVANHVSWLDIPVIAAHYPVVFLSKSEVRDWPLIGAVATGLGTLYIERGGRNAAATAVERMREGLEQGQRVVLFPEGTTSDGAGLLPFRPRLYQAAVAARVPVQPLALSYRDADGEPSELAPFVDNVSLLSHVWRLAGNTGIRAQLELAAPIVGERRTELARQSQVQVARLLRGERALDE